MFLASLSLLSCLLFFFFFIAKNSNSYTGDSCCVNCNGKRSLT